MNINFMSRFIQREEEDESKSNWCLYTFTGVERQWPLRRNLDARARTGPHSDSLSLSVRSCLLRPTATVYKVPSHQQRSCSHESTSRLGMKLFTFFLVCG